MSTRHIVFRPFSFHVLLLFFAIFLAAIAIPISAQAQSRIRLQWDSIPKWMGKDALTLASGPCYWKSADWTRMAVSAGTVLVVGLGDSFFDRQVQTDPGLASFGKTFLEPFGNVEPLSNFSLGIMVASFGYGWASGNVRLASTSLKAGEAWILTAVTVAGLKYLVGRHRPDQPSTKPWDFSGPNWGQHQSFPSGHAALSFAVASVFAHEYSDYPVVPIMAWSVAGLAGISRVYRNQHWASDVVAGALIGSAIGMWVSGRNRGRIFFQPRLDPASPGLGLVIPLNSYSRTRSSSINTQDFCPE